MLIREALPDDMVPHPTEFFTPELRPEPPAHEMPRTPQEYFDPAYLLEFQRYCKQVMRTFRLAEATPQTSSSGAKGAEREDAPSKGSYRPCAAGA